MDNETLLDLERQVADAYQIGTHAYTATEQLRSDLDAQLYECRVYADESVFRATNSISDIVSYLQADVENLKQSICVDLARSIVDLVKKHYCFETTPEHDSQFYQELEQLYTFN